MLKKIKNSTVIFLGIIIICIGILIGLSEYFDAKKNKAFSEMNILLYQNELPDSIESDDELNIKKEENPIEDDTIEEPEANSTNNEGSSAIQTNYNYIGILEIPKINLKRGFLNLDSKYNNVNYNITIINGSSFPNIDKSNLILAAHSGICSICYFDNLYKLSVGDIAYIYYNGVKYTYSITNIYNVEKTGKVSIYRNTDKKTLTLITCTRNSKTEQTVYILEIVNEENY